VIDFIVKLPKLLELITKNEYNSIIVTIDRLTKQAYFILVNKTIIVEELAYIYYRYIWLKYRTPEEMITDRGI
jgi:hypothetical protein